MPITRVIVGFGQDDQLVFSQEFPEERFIELRPLFDYGDDEQMYGGSCEVTETNRDLVASILGIELRPGVYYYLEGQEER